MRLNNDVLHEAIPLQALTRIRELLHQRSLRMTHRRVAIVRAALARQGHFSLEDLSDDLRALGVRASRATLYRTLPLLIAAGILQPTLLSGEDRRYEGSFGREHHDHLICQGCGQVVEFQFEAFEMLQREVAQKHGFEITGHIHELIGLCRECRAGGENARAL